VLGQCRQCDQAILITPVYSRLGNSRVYSAASDKQKRWFNAVNDVNNLAELLRMELNLSGIYLAAWYSNKDVIVYQFSSGKCDLLARSFGPGWGEVYKRPHAPGLRLRGKLSRW